MEITYIDIGIFALVFIFAFYYYGLRSYNYFKNTGIKYIKPELPYVGLISSVILRKETFYGLFKRLYDEYPEEKYVGLFEGTKPLILLRDLELIKSVGIKNFDTFHDHRNFMPNGVEDDIITHILFIMQGEKWREMRAALSPAFTSSKMRQLFVFMDECAKDMAEYFIRSDEMKEKGLVEIGVKDTTARYTNDVIANTVFGLKVNSLEDKDNDIYKYGLLANTQTAKQMLKMYGFIFFPSLMKWLKVRFSSSDVADFFEKLVKDAMEHREKTGFVRHDMINLLMEAKKGSLVHDVNNADLNETGFATVEESNVGKKETNKKWTDLELAAQAFLFFLAGFETTSTTLMFFLYELVRNPDIQKKLQESIDECLEKSEGKPGYQDILNLKYLDMCTSEILRMWPPVGAVDRVCTKPFTLPPPNENSTKTYEVQKDHLVWIPVYGMMHDSKYYQNPQIFDPERFSDENKSKINPMTYLPFGIGPRNCIGSRFALLEMKILIFHLLSKFNIVPVDSTQIPLKLKKGMFQIKPEKEVRVGLKLR